MLNRAFKAVIGSWFLWLVAGVLILWGYQNDGWIRIVIGCFIIYIAVSTSIEEYKVGKVIDKWFQVYEGKIFFFYPTKKQIQNRIREIVLPLFERDVLQIYYDGPTLTGDADNLNFILKRTMFFNYKIRPNVPSIIKIENRDLKVIAELSDLIKINDEKFDMEEVKRKIKQACG